MNEFRASQVTTEFQRFVRWKTLKDRVPFSRSTIWRMVREGDFPKPVRIGKYATAWLESEIAAWINERAESRND